MFSSCYDMLDHLASSPVSRIHICLSFLSRCIVLLPSTLPAMLPFPLYLFVSYPLCIILNSFRHCFPYTFRSLSCVAFYQAPICVTHLPFFFLSRRIKSYQVSSSSLHVPSPNGIGTLVCIVPRIVSPFVCNPSRGPWPASSSVEGVACAERGDHIVPSNRNRLVFRFTRHLYVSAVSAVHIKVVS